MHVGEMVPVTYEAVDGFDRKINKTVTGRCVFVHPEGRYATVEVPSGLRVTVYPPSRVGSLYDGTDAEVEKNRQYYRQHRDEINARRRAKWRAKESL